MIRTIKYDDRGLVPAIIQDTESGEILMMAYMNEASLQKTIDTGFTHFWSRSRQTFWKKGESSGHVQQVKQVLIDCDADTLLVRVNQIGGAACHEGYQSCFFRRLEGDELKVVADRVFDPAEVYQKKS